MKKFLFAFLVCAVATSAWGAELQWFGGAHDRDWFNTANWGPAGGPIPTNVDKAKINYVWANPGPIINASATVGEIFVSEDLDMGTIGQQTVTIAAGGNVVTGSPGSVPYEGQINLGYFAPNVVPGHPGNDGKLIMDGGTMTTGGHFWLGWNGKGTLQMNSGTLNVGTVAVPRMFGIGWGGVGVGEVHLDGGLLHTTQWWGATAWLDTHNYTFDITGGTWEINGFWTNQLTLLKERGWITAYGDPEKVVITWDAEREITVVTPEPVSISLLGLGALALLRKRS